MKWIYWYTPSQQLYTVGVINGQGIVICTDSDWPNRDAARRRTVVLNGGDPAALEPRP